MKPILSLLLAITLVSACATRDKEPENEAAQRLASTSAPPSVPTAGLPAQSLAAGECGIFLWGLTTPRRFVFFSETTSGEALVLVEETAKTVKLIAARGDVIGSFLTQTEFGSDDQQLMASLVIVPGEELEDGQRITSGRLVTRGADGWETILPVAGLHACIPG